MLRLDTAQIPLSAFLLSTGGVMSVKIHHVIHSRKLNSYEQATAQVQQEERESFSIRAKESQDEFQRLLESGWQILDSFDASHHLDITRCYVLQFEGKIEPTESQLHMLYEVEIKSTYSKTHDTNFDYISCKHGLAQLLNIFDHPDPERNTWKICESRGWTWQGLQYAIMHGMPVPVRVSHDGDWWSLVDIMPVGVYFLDVNKTGKYEGHDWGKMLELSEENHD